MPKIEDRLQALGIVLPDSPSPVANYVPHRAAGCLAHISGQLPVGPNGVVTGTVGDDVDLDAARAAARLCGINLIAQFKAAAGGDLDRIAAVVKLGGFVQAAADFDGIPQVINGCSDLMVDVFGDAGRHARSAVGVYRLPLNCPVEIDAIVQLRA